MAKQTPDKPRQQPGQVADQQLAVRATKPDQGGLLDKPRVISDLNLIRRALRERWPIPDETRKILLERLKAIIEKPTVMHAGPDGPVALDGPADANAVRAASVLVAMTAQNQADDHLADKNARLDAGQATDRVAIVPQVTLRGLPEDEGDGEDD